MIKTSKLLIVASVLVAFGMATMALAQEFYVVKDSAGKLAVVDKKPDDAKSIVKGPFKTKAEAEEALKASAPAPGKKPVKPPDEGC